MEGSFEQMEGDAIHLQRLWDSCRRAQDVIERSHRALLESGTLLAKLQHFETES